ncbi:Pentatricopeptide repeat-containing protein [Drosera capensis]
MSQQHQLQTPIFSFQSLQSNPKFTINFTSNINFSSPNCLKPIWASSISQIQPPKISALDKSVWRRATSSGAKNHRNLPSSHEIDVGFLETKIHGYCKAGRTKEAARALQILEISGAVPNVKTYTVLIRNYCKDQNVDKALQLFYRMKGLCDSGKLDKALEVFDGMKVAPNEVTYNTLLKGLCDSGKLDKALEVFNGMKVAPDVVTYSTLLKGLCDSGKMDKALVVFDGMKVAPDVVTYSTVLKALCDSGKMDKALEVFDGMKVAPNEVTYNTLLKGLCDSGKLDKALEVFNGMKVFPDVVTYSTLLKGLCDSGKMDTALEVFDGMKGLCDSGKMDKALEVFDGMKVAPNEVTYSTVLKGLCDSGKMDKALEVFDGMKVAPNDVTYSTLLKGLCDSRKMDKALEVFDGMKVAPDVVTYSTLLKGLCDSKKLDKVLEVFDGMKVAPNEVTYNIVIDGLSKAGKTEQARGTRNYYMKRTSETRVVISLDEFLIYAMYEWNPTKEELVARWYSRNHPIPPGTNYMYHFQVKDQIGSFYYYPSIDEPPANIDTSDKITLAPNVLNATFRGFVEVIFENHEKGVQSWHVDGYSFFPVA